jgi:hypothetical protein
VKGSHVRTSLVFAAFLLGAGLCAGPSGTTTAANAQGAGATAQKVQPSPQKVHEVQKDFEQARRRAIVARAPGGEPAAEATALLASLKKQHAASVGSENARVEKVTARLRSSTPPASGKGKKGTPADGVHAPGTGPAPTKPPFDPCGSVFELKSVQATPPLDPREKIVVEGCGFGERTNDRAEIALVGDGLPGGRLKLTVTGWFPTWIAATVPAIGGVRDLPNVRLQMVRSDGRVSNWLDVGGFRATREVRQILQNDLQVACGASSPADDKECSPLGTTPAETKFFSGASLAIKRARSTTHKEDCSAVDLLDTNVQEKTDTAAVSLANGWVLAGYAWWWGGDDAWVLAPSGYVANASSATITMKTGLWVNRCRGPYHAFARYRVDLFAVGPTGVPYK